MNRLIGRFIVPLNQYGPLCHVEANNGRDLIQATGILGGIFDASPSDSTPGKSSLQADQTGSALSLLRVCFPHTQMKLVEVSLRLGDYVLVSDIFLEADVDLAVQIGDQFGEKKVLLGMLEVQAAYWLIQNKKTNGYTNLNTGTLNHPADDIGALVWSICKGMKDAGVNPTAVLSPNEKIPAL